MPISFIKMVFSLSQFLCNFYLDAFGVQFYSFQTTMCFIIQISQRLELYCFLPANVWEEKKNAPSDKRTNALAQYTHPANSKTEFQMFKIRHKRMFFFGCCFVSSFFFLCALRFKCKTWNFRLNLNEKGVKAVDNIYRKKLALQIETFNAEKRAFLWNKNKAEQMEKNTRNGKGQSEEEIDGEGKTFKIVVFGRMPISLHVDSRI